MKYNSLSQYSLINNAEVYGISASNNENINEIKEITVVLWIENGNELSNVVHLNIHLRKNEKSQPPIYLQFR